MSLARKAVRGAAVTIAASVMARAMGVIGTLVLTRFLAPEVMGEVAAATILVVTTSELTTYGFGPYIVVRGGEGAHRVFHAVVFNVLFGLLGFSLIYFIGPHFGPMLDAPDVDEFIPGMIAAIAIRRFAAMWDKVLMREMRFRAIAVAQGIAEVAYATSAVLLAMRGYGGHSIVIANILQSCVLAAILLLSVHYRKVLTPARLTWQGTRDLFRFGWPLGINSAAHHAGNYWDNLLYSSYFGVAQMGLYNLGYNLASIPGTQVGEHISTVLLPSMGKLPPERRTGALVRSTALLGLLIFPMAVGLAAIADTLIALVLNEEWQPVAPLLTALSVVSVFRPLSWTLNSYMVSQERTVTVMLIEVAKVAVLLGSVALLARFGPLVACAAVGIAFGSHVVIGVATIVARDGVDWRAFAAGFVRPLVACVPMAAAVLGVRALLGAAGIDAPAVRLPAEIITGIIVYVPSAFVCAPAIARDFLHLVRTSFFRRSPASADGPGQGDGR